MLECGLERELRVLCDDEGTGGIGNDGGGKGDEGGDSSVTSLRIGASSFMLMRTS